FDRANEDLHRVLLGTVVNQIERLADDPRGLLFLAGVFTRLHKAVDQPFDDRDLTFLELLAGVTPHRVLDRGHSDVALGGGVSVLDARDLPAFEEFRAGFGDLFFGRLVGLGGFGFAHRTGFSAFPRTSSISETPFTFSTL